MKSIRRPSVAARLFVAFASLVAGCSAQQRTAVAGDVSAEVFTVRGITVELGHGLIDLARTESVDVRAHLSKQLTRIQDTLRGPATTMTIAIGWGGVVPEIGVGGGIDPGNGHVTVNVAPKPRVGLREALLRRVPVTMAHELNHAKRVVEGDGCWLAESTTMAEALVCEGLADAFARQVYPDAKTPHSDALTPAEESRMWGKIRTRVGDDLPREDFPRWFMSGGRGGIPQWTGYTIGFHIVRSYLRTHPGTTAAEITLMDADELIANSGYDAR